MKRLAEENLHKRATAFGMPIRSRLVTPNKSVYAYAIDDVRWWEDKLGRSLEYGEFGERWAIGTGVFEVSEPQIPCWRLGVRMNDQLFPRRFTEALRLGTYLRIIVEDAVDAGDEIRIIERPAHDLTVRDIFRIYTRDREEVERLLAVPRISESWRGWAQHFSRKRKVGAHARLLLDVADIQAEASAKSTLCGERGWVAEAGTMPWPYTWCLLDYRTTKPRPTITVLSTDNPCFGRLRRARGLSIRFWPVRLRSSCVSRDPRAYIR
jgi:hypothetical protein